MDSGNSGSMQSSSGGDEEYDSRADSISAFFNTPGGLASLSHQYHTRVPSTSLHHNPPAANAASSSSPPLFDPLYVYFDGLARSPPTLTSSSSPLGSLDMPWPPRGIGPSNPSSCTDVVGLMASAPPSSNTTGTAVSFPMGAGLDLYSGGVSVGVSPLPSSSLPPLQQQPSSASPPQNPATAAAGAATAAPPRSSKKRSRASRRASTTVLTTDTSNFRAMVQEFTGLPAPPFSSSPFPRSRFDLLHAAASSSFPSTKYSSASVLPMVGSKKASPGGTPLGASRADYTVASGFSHGHADARLATTQSSTEPAGMISSRGGSGEAAGDDLLRWVEGPVGGSDRGDQFRPAGGSSQRGSSCKLNYGGTASSDYHAEKGAENVSSTRGEESVCICEETSTVASTRFCAKREMVSGWWSDQSETTVVDAGS
ncbi:hypothetical protein Taro_047229 [Colocasia esculenta]|uniref:VQ domain-containing protein n=1 Tax=Colocasia esculenta TaxID=4460 RepID=A0A843X3J8_COLES|nr:hypothetical protein [Colocasia esculenta]